MFFTVYVAFPSCVSDSGRERSASCQTRNSTQTAGPYREHHPVSSRGPAGDLTQTAEPLTLSQHWPSRAERTRLTDVHACAALQLDPPQVHLFLQICCPWTDNAGVAKTTPEVTAHEWWQNTRACHGHVLLNVSPCEIHIPSAVKHEDGSGNDCAGTPERLEWISWNRSRTCTGRISPQNEELRFCLKKIKHIWSLLYINTVTLFHFTWTSSTLYSYIYIYIYINSVMIHTFSYSNYLF